MMRRVGACVAAAAMATGSAGFLALASWLCCIRDSNARRLYERVLATCCATSPKKAALALESPEVKALQDTSDDECTPLTIQRVEDDTAAGVNSDQKEPTWESSSDSEEHSTLDEIDYTSERRLWSRASSCSFDSNDKTTASELDFASTDGEAEADVISLEQTSIRVKGVNFTAEGTLTAGGTTAEPAGRDASREEAFALAHQLVPHTTVTGLFYIHRGVPDDDAEASPANTRSYALLKAQFEATAREWVSTQFDVLESLDDGSKHAALEATLVATYAKLVASQEFADEQSELVQRWECANVAINEVAFRVVRSALYGYARAMASSGCTTLMRLNVLEQRLDSLRVLDIFYPQDMRGRKWTPVSLIQSVDMERLSLLELRALAHVFESDREARQHLSSPDAAKEMVRHTRLRRALMNVKDDYDAHRRLQMEDRAGTGRCCMSRQMCAFRTSWECVIPIYKAHANANLVTAYCDLEASTH